MNYYYQILKEIDIEEFHMQDPRELQEDYGELLEDFGNGAIELITHGGQHVKVSNLPCKVNEELIFAQGDHFVTFYEILNRLFGLGIKVEKIKKGDEDFRENIRSTINNALNGKSILGTGYFTPEITIIHYNELDPDGDVNQRIIVFLPAYVTPAQFSLLEKTAKYYEDTLLEVCIETLFSITEWDPINCVKNDKLKSYPKTFKELCTFLRENNRIRDYKLPIEEHIVSYDFSLGELSNSNQIGKA